MPSQPPTPSSRCSTTAVARYVGYASVSTALSEREEALASLG